MSGIIDVPAAVRELVLNDGRGYRWLASSAAVPLEELLDEVLYGTTEMKISNALGYSAAFGITLGDLVGAAERSTHSRQAKVHLRSEGLTPTPGVIGRTDGFGAAGGRMRGVAAMSEAGVIADSESGQAA